MSGIRRRDFLAGAAAAGIGARSIRAIAQATKSPAAAEKLPDVVQVTGDFVVRGHRVHQTMLTEMLDLTLRRVTGKETVEAAWQSLFGPDDVIGIKFNSSGAANLGVVTPFGEVLVKSLVAAGFDPSKLRAIEAPSELLNSQHLAEADAGWDADETDFGSGADRFSAALNEVTALINVPFLKTHNIAGMTCSLKNLSHAMVKHPARYHGNHCAPYIADIVNHPKIRSKLRLHLVNALRVVFDRGPEAHRGSTWDAGIVLAGLLPVPVDTIGADIINSQRKIVGLSTIPIARGSTQYLADAERHGLGESNLHRIVVHKARI